MNRGRRGWEPLQVGIRHRGGEPYEGWVWKKKRESGEKKGIKGPVVPRIKKANPHEIKTATRVHPSSKGKTNSRKPHQMEKVKKGQYKPPEMGVASPNVRS